MTAEIAIINRTAVTLAADSAMTLSGGPTDKIYNSADKIFELSTKDPIGIMIYSNLQFMNFPLDVAIKHFRDSSKCSKFNSVSAAADAFFKFLQDEIGAPEDAQQLHVRRLAGSIFNLVSRDYHEKIDEIVAANPKGPPKDFDPDALFAEQVNSYLGPVSKRPPADGFTDNDLTKIRKNYGDAIQSAIVDVFDLERLSDDAQALLHDLAARIFHCNIISPASTGVVFAGFGSADLFPSLYSFELDGLIVGKLRLRKKKPILIDRVKRTAEISPFAQHDMADRFLYGIDPEFEDNIPEFLEAALRRVGEAIIAEVPAAKSKNGKQPNLQSKLERAITLAVQEFKVSAMNEVKDGYKQQILEMVSFMPKQELANFAESLINITSIKRRVSAEQETVGGPIDVAVISRSDGFIWVKRKHYFDPSLNPRFFFRKHGMVTPGLTGDRK